MQQTDNQVDQNNEDKEIQEETKDISSLRDTKSKTKPPPASLRQPSDYDADDETRRIFIAARQG